MAKFLIVEARFYDHLNDMLVAGASAQLKKHGHQYDVMVVPGALEIPGAIAMASESEEYDGFVAIGVVIRGETSHYDHVADGCALGIQQVQLDSGVPVLFGVLTTETIEQAEARIDRVGEVVRGALEMANVFQQLRAAAK